MEILANLQAATDRAYVRDRRYPKPTADGHLSQASIGTTESDSAVVLDGFGRPIRYRVRGAWKIKTYQFRSDGGDGKPSDDDLCVSGGTPLAELAQSALERLRQRRGEASIPDTLTAIAALSCGGAEQGE